MIKAIIVEDEMNTGEMIQSLVHSFSKDFHFCKSCQSIKEALKEIKLHEPEVIFLDIELPDGLGFEILEQFPNLNARVIFITAYDHYAMRAIKFNAFDYILKPIIPEELQETLNKVIKEIRKKSVLPDAHALLQYLKDKNMQRVAVPNKNGFQYYQIDDIVMIEGDGSYALMYLANNSQVVVSKKIKDFEESLSGKGFLRVHKSYLVNMNHIAELHRDDSGYLLMSNRKKVPISPKDKEEIITQIKLYSSII